MVVSAFSSWRSAMLVNICRNLTTIWGCRSINTSKSGLKNPNKVQSVLHKADVLRFRLYPMDKLQNYQVNLAESIGLILYSCSSSWLLDG